MESYAENRSATWQESERGAEFEEQLEALREVVSAVEELTAVPEKTPPKPLTIPLSCLVRRLLFHFGQEVVHINTSILQGSFERVTVNLVMERKHDFSAVCVFHLDVTAAPMNLRKAQAL